MKKIIGILGGLGPETTANFYLDVVRAATRRVRPAVLISSLPLNLRYEAEYISRGEHQGYYRARLLDGLSRLERAGSSFVVIPCNTVHEFHTELARQARVPVANLIELVAEEAKGRDWRRVTLLATSRTVETGLYQTALGRLQIAAHLPSATEQLQLDRLIMGLLGERTSGAHQRFLQKLIKNAGAEAVILGCTDLQIIARPSETVIDSTAVLVKHATDLFRS